MNERVATLRKARRDSSDINDLIHIPKFVKAANSEGRVEDKALEDVHCEMYQGVPNADAEEP